MYNSSQYANSGYQYPQYQQGYAANYSYQGYEQYSTQNVQPLPPGDAASSAPNSWNASMYTTSKNDAVAQEMLQQKAQLTRQREDYVRKVSVLRRELDQLRIQKQQLINEGRSSDRDLGSILTENNKLQEEIQGKMKAIQNVIEMLSSIIKDGRSMADLEASLNINGPARSPQLSRSESVYSKRSQSPDVSVRSRSPDKYCYVHYDTGLHWCRLCDEFPETAKDFLLHLQEKEHREMVKENDVDITPWHKMPAEKLLPSEDNSPKKRVPIKGLQFFISAPSWYCKLCDVWIGDLHCASHHLKSVTHFQNYENFVSQNPQWEMDWLKDRERAMTRKGVNSSDSEDSKKRKHKNKRLSELLNLKDKKKKKHSKKKRKRSSDSSSSSSSSDSSSDDDDDDKSKSIRVKMRNMKQVQSIMDEDLAKWSVLEKLVEEHKKKEERDKKEKSKDEKDDPLINQWMTVSQPLDKDKALLESLKDRMKQKQIVEKAKHAEIELKRLEQERIEKELKEKREKAERETAEQAEREKLRREQEEMEHIRNKDRDQVRFKTNYRRKRSHSRSDEDENNHDRYKNDRHRKASESERERGRSRSSHNSRSRSKTPDHRHDNGNDKKKPPGPPSYRKLPFIGRMPLFKNKVRSHEEKEEKKEIQKESYEPQRRTRFQPGNLAKAFIPRPDVVCFPKLSSIPPLTVPPPPTVSEMEPPAPPKISDEKKKSSLKAPPPPKIEAKDEQPANLSDDEVLYADQDGLNPSMIGQFYQEYQDMMYAQDMYQYQHGEAAPPPPEDPDTYTMPLQPPPLPPEDDLALLGICADDMAAQSF